MVGSVKIMKLNFVKMFYKYLIVIKVESKEKILDNLLLYGLYCSVVFFFCLLVGLFVGLFFICLDLGFSCIFIRMLSLILNGFFILFIGDILFWEFLFYGIV